VKKGDVLQWDFAAEKRIHSVEVDILEGRARASLLQAKKNRRFKKDHKLRIFCNNQAACAL